MQMTPEIKAALAAQGMKGRTTPLVFATFIDTLYDLVTEDFERDSGSIDAIFAATMSDDDYDEIREECSETEDLVGHGRMRAWIAYDTKARTAKLTEAGRLAALAIAPLMGWPADPATGGMNP